MTTSIRNSQTLITPLPDIDLINKKCDQNQRELQNLVYTILMLKQEISLLAEKQEEIEELISITFKNTNTLSNHLEEKNIDENINIINEPPTNQEETTFKCPGHSDFFHRYQILKKAKKKAETEVKKKEKEPHIKKAHYELIIKDSAEGKKTVYFKGLNAIYNYAINIIYYHEDDNRFCPYHPDYLEPVELIY